MYSLEIVYILFFIKTIPGNWSRVIILNGNHEDASLYTYQTFKSELLSHDLNRLNHTSRKGADGDDQEPGLTVMQHATVDGGLGTHHSTDTFFKIETIMFRLPCVLFTRYTRHGDSKRSASKRSDSKQSDSKNEKDASWVQFCHGGIDQHFGFQRTDNTLNDFLNKYDFEFLNLNHPEHPLSTVQIESSGFKWSDFKSSRVMKDQVRLQCGCTSCPYKSPRGAGEVYDEYSTLVYLENNGIQCIVSGHQDFINGFAVLPKEHHTAKLVYIPESTVCGSANSHYIYPLFGPTQLWEDSGCEYTQNDDDIPTFTEIVPGHDLEIPLTSNDFSALITSAASVPRKLDVETFLIMKSGAPLEERRPRHRTLQRTKRHGRRMKVI